MKRFLLIPLLPLLALAQTRSFYTDRPDIFGSDISLGAGGTAGSPSRAANTAKSFTLAAPLYTAATGRGTFPAVYFTDDGTDRSLYLGRSTGGLTDFRVYTSTYGSPTSGNVALTIPGTGIARFEYAVVFVGNPRPSADNTVDLGSSSFSFKDGWFDGDVLVGSGGKVQFQSRTRMESGSDGVLSIRTAAAGNMTRVLFGTANSSGPALSFSGATVKATDGLGALGVFSSETIELGNASDTTIARLGSGVISVEGVRVATEPDVEMATYSGTTVTIAANKDGLQQHVLTCTNSFTLAFSGLTAKDAGIITVWPAATNCTVTLSSYCFGPSGTTLTITGGTGNTNYTEIAWKNLVVDGTNRVSVNALNYYR